MSVSFYEIYKKKLLFIISKLKKLINFMRLVYNLIYFLVSNTFIYNHRLAHIGQFLNGIAGCTVMAAPSFISNVWFLPQERVTATSIMGLFNYFGNYKIHLYELLILF